MRVCSFPAHGSLRSRRLALVSCCLPHSLSLLRPDNRRAPLSPASLARGARPSWTAAFLTRFARSSRTAARQPCTWLAPLAEAGARELLPSSLASLARPGQQRASLAHGSL